MKKLIALLTVFVISLSLLVVSGCKKPQGTFYVDNSTAYTVDVSWNGYSMSAGAYASKSWTVDTGSGYATVYVEGYGYLDDVYVSIDSGGTDGVSVYYTKSADGGTKTLHVVAKVIKTNNPNKAHQ